METVAAVRGGHQLSRGRLEAPPQYLHQSRRGLWPGLNREKAKRRWISHQSRFGWKQVRMERCQCHECQDRAFAQFRIALDQKTRRAPARLETPARSAVQRGARPNSGCRTREGLEQCPA